MTNTFENPYVHVPVEESWRVSTNISPSAYAAIKGIRPGQGTIKIVLGLLVERAVEELTHRHITDFTKVKEYERFFANCRIVDAAELEQLRRDSAAWHEHLTGGVGGGLRDGAASGPTTERSPDERIGTAPVRPADASDAPVATNVQSGSRSRRARARATQSEGTQSSIA